MGYEPVPGEVDMHKGSLYTVDSKTDIRTHLTEVSIANGMAWDTKLNKFYYIDSPTRRIDQFDCNMKSGTICKLQFYYTLTLINIYVQFNNFTIKQNIISETFIIM